jgi:type I restriction enzyme, S subunit
MTTALPPYPAYKDSGAPWLGEVPEHWDLRRFKYVLKERDGRSKTGAEQLLRVSQYTGVTERRRADGLDGPDSRAETLVGYKSVEPGELVVNIMLAWNGSMGVSEFEGIVSPAYCVYRFGKQAEPQYFHHLLRSPVYKARIKALSTGVVESRLRLYTEDLYRLEATLPSVAEQSAIVRYLGHVDRKIQKAIRAKLKLIKLLQEQKQAIIHRAVTGQIDVRTGQPYPDYKSSGVEWLGNVPDHWEVSRLSRLIRSGTSITYGIVQAGPDVHDGIPYIRTSDMKGDGFVPGGFLRTSLEIDRSHSRSKVATNDLVVAIRASLGKGLLVPPFLNGANLTQGTARVSPGAGLRPRFLMLAFNSPYCQENIRFIAKGTTFLEITLEGLRRIVLAVPPLREQDQIILHLDERTASLDRVREDTGKEISLLREYRMRLISDVVTGKLDVRETAAQLPEEIAEVEPMERTDDLPEEIGEGDGPETDYPQED